MNRALGVLSILILITISGCGGNDESVETTESSGIDVSSADREFAEECLDRLSLDSLAMSQISSLGSFGDVKISSGLHESFPDACLVTVASPSIDEVLQFTETGGEGLAWRSVSASIDDLPSSVTDWIAVFNPETDGIEMLSTEFAEQRADPAFALDAEGCFERFNSDPSAGASTAATYATQGDGLASAVPAEAFPELCVVTVANPTSGEAMQFTETPSPNIPWRSVPILIEALAPTYTDWSGTVEPDSGVIEFSR